MSVLTWDRPKRRLAVQDWRRRRRPVSGGYVPNMSEADRQRWRARIVRGKDPRVEIRKGFDRAQLVIVVRPNGVTLSANGTVPLDGDGWNELKTAVWEALEVLTAAHPQLDLGVSRG